MAMELAVLVQQKSVVAHFSKWWLNHQLFVYMELPKAHMELPKAHMELAKADGLLSQ